MQAPLFAVEVPSDFDMWSVVFIGDREGATGYIDKLEFHQDYGDPTYRLSEWNFNSTKHKRLEYTPANLRIRPKSAYRGDPDE